MHPGAKFFQLVDPGNKKTSYLFLKYNGEKGPRIVVGIFIQKGRKWKKEGSSVSNIAEIRLGKLHLGSSGAAPPPGPAAPVLDFFTSLERQPVVYSRVVLPLLLATDEKIPRHLC